ncbi:folylpolyglutamate synthase/dihydrofolate synthase family protein [Microlunatus panaciterrae]|uniref:tetrahydrofolate synthase n=1 Tax=Microlunatus panaciterrae TaxID=400768 RepID=A0ABS2RMN1_9ACTN|nr:folylpolyglutamate synthase/dihydrofolate synthase family protein [Microlunatus panaciterrae]MBM7799938.1 dihydrofolate synthase/folylpolyglutamate synthase [Microlunatus panaciterrae]
MVADSHAQVVAALTSRWPEHRVAPSLGRIQALTRLLGDPQKAYPVIHVAGTNGKGSTAAMIESLLRANGLRTGRFASPHVMDVTERIALDGEPISADRFDELWHEIEPYVQLVDDQQIDGVAMTFFEIITGMAFAAFADAPVDVAVIEVGLGGTWDATNVADAGVAVITPIDLDHTHLLGDTVQLIAREKAGVIKPGAQAILAGQSLEAATVLLERCGEVGALVHREGIDFGVLDRVVAVGGQLIRLNASEGPVDEILLPLHGAHQAANAAVALAAVEAFLGMKALNPDVVREGFADVQIPARMEVVRSSPTVVLDAAHNPHGARAAAATITEAFDFNPLIGVVAVMGDKDAEGVLRTFEEVMNQVVVTQVASSTRGMPAAELGELAEGIFGTDRVQVVARMDEAIERAVTMAESDTVGAAGVLVTGSVVAVGEARTLLAPQKPVRRPPRVEVVGAELGADESQGDDADEWDDPDHLDGDVTEAERDKWF